MSGLTGEMSGVLGSVPWDLGHRAGEEPPGANLLLLAALLRAPHLEGHASKSPGKASGLVVKGHRASGRGQEEEGRAVPVVCPEKTMTFLLWYVNEALKQKWARPRLATAVLHPMVSTPTTTLAQRPEGSGSGA